MAGGGGVNIPVNANLGPFFKQLATVRQSLGVLAATGVGSFAKIGAAARGLLNTYLAYKKNPFFASIGLAPGKGVVYAVASLQTVGKVMQYIINQSRIWAFQIQQIGLIFAPIMTNYARLYAIGRGFAPQGLTLAGRYADYVTILAISKELVHNQTLLAGAMNAVSSPIKLVRTWNRFNAALAFSKFQLNLLITQTGVLSNSLLASANSLSANGGFLSPLQAATSLNVFTQFDPQNAIESAIAFQRSTKQLTALMTASGSTGKELKKLSHRILTTGIDTEKTSEEITAFANQLSVEGLSSEEIEESLEAFAVASDISLEPMERLFDLADSIGRSFGESTESIGEVAKQIAGFAASTGTGIDQVTRILNRVNESAPRANQSLTDTLAAINLLMESGESVQELGFSMERLFEAMELLQAAPTDRQQEGLSQLGLDVDDLRTADGELRSFIDVISVLKARMGDLSSVEQRNIAELLFGARGGESVVAALGATNSELTNFQQVAMGSADYASEAAEALGGNLLSTLQRLSDSVIAISTTLGNNLSPILNAVIKPIVNVVDAFASLPPSVQFSIVAFNVLLPLIYTYYRGIKVAIYFTKVKAIALKALATAQKLYSGELTVGQVASKLFNELQQVGAKLMAIKSGIVGVLTGKISLLTAAQNTYNAIAKVGSANMKEYVSTTIQATKILTSHILKLGLMVAAWKALGEIFRKSEGAVAAGGVRELTAETVRANAELYSFQDRIEVFGSGAVGTFRAVGMGAEEGFGRVQTAIGGAMEAYVNFQDTLRDKGAIEAMQGAIDGLARRMGDVGAGDELLGDQDFWNTLTSGSQLGAQREFLAYGDQMKALDPIYQKGIDLLMQYRDGMTLTAEETEKMRGEMTAHATSLEQIRQGLLAQEPTNERARVLRDLQIESIEKQQEALRGRILSLNEEGGVIRSVSIPSFDELIAKYQELNRVRALETSSALADIEEAIAAGEMDSAIAEQEKAQVERRALLAQAEATKTQIAELTASQAGASSEDAPKLQEELNSALQRQVDLRSELAQNQQEINKMEADTAVQEARAGIVEAVNDEKQNQLALEREIAAAGLTGEEAERRRLELSERALRQELEANRAAAAALEGSAGPGVEDERGKLEDERIALELELTRISQRENQKRVAAEEAAAEEAAEAQRAAVEKAAADRMSALDLEKKERIEAVRAAGLAEGEEARRILEVEAAFAEKRMEALKARRAAVEALADSRALTEEEAADKIGEIDRELTEERVGLSERRREAEEAATGAAVKAIEERLSAERSAVELRESALGFAADDLGLQRELSDARRALADVEEERADSRLQHALELAEISEDEAAVERAKAAIYDDRLRDIEREAERKRENLAVERELSAIELDRKETTAEIAVLEARANIAKAEAQSASEAELAALRQILDLRGRQLERIDAERANAEAVNDLQARQIEAERQLGVEQARQSKTVEERRAQVEAEKAAEEAKGEAASRTADEQERQKEILDAIAATYDRQTEAITLQSDRLQLANDLLSEQSNLLSGRAEMEAAVSDLALQRLNFQLEAAKLAEDEEAIAAATESIRKRELDSLLARQEADRRSLILKQEQERVAARQKKLAAEIAVLEARANVEKARAEGKSAKEIEALSKIAALRKEQLGLAEEQAANLEDVQAMEAVTQTAEQQAAREGLEQGYALEDAREAAQRLAEDEKAREEGGEGTLSASERRSLERDLESVTEAPPLETDPQGIRDALTETLTAQREADSKALSEAMENQNREFKDSLAEIREVLANRKTVENLTVVSADPMSDAASVIDDLAGAGAG